MQWIITEDHINGGLGDDIPSRANRICAAPEFGQRLRAAAPEAKKALREEFKATMTDEFRLFDDDGELYYEGLCKDLDDQDEDSAFEPLDWAANDAGCTTMKHRKIGSKGNWSVL